MVKRRQNPMVILVIWTAILLTCWSTVNEFSTFLPPTSTEDKSVLRLAAACFQGAILCYILFLTASKAFERKKKP